MKSIIYLFRLTCTSWLPCLRTSGSELGWDLGFEILFSVNMVLGVPVVYQLGYSINMLLELEIYNYFGTWEISLVRFTLGTLTVLMIRNGEGHLVGLSLGLPIRSPLDSPNPGLTEIILDMYLENPLGYLLESIWNINWCGTWMRTWKFL